VVFKKKGGKKKKAPKGCRKSFSSWRGRIGFFWEEKPSEDLPQGEGNPVEQLT